MFLHFCPAAERALKIHAIRSTAGYKGEISPFPVERINCTTVLIRSTDFLTSRKYLSHKDL